MADHSSASNTKNHPPKEAKSPSAIERAKEEIESLFHHKSPRHSRETHGTSGDIDETTPVDEVKAPDVFERVKEEFEAVAGSLHQKKNSKEEIESHVHPKSPRHHRETHGTSDDIDETTPVSEVKGPNVFERVREEVEAIAGAFHQKKDSKDHK